MCCQGAPHEAEWQLPPPCQHVKAPPCQRFATEQQVCALRSQPNAHTLTTSPTQQKFGTSAQNLQPTIMCVPVTRPSDSEQQRFASIADHPRSKTHIANFIHTLGSLQTFRLQTKAPTPKWNKATISMPMCSPTKCLIASASATSISKYQRYYNVTSSHFEKLPPL